MRKRLILLFVTGILLHGYASAAEILLEEEQFMDGADELSVFSAFDPDTGEEESELLETDLFEMQEPETGMTEWLEEYFPEDPFLLGDDPADDSFTDGIVLRENTAVEEDEIELPDAESMLGSDGSSGMCGDNLTWTLDEEGTLTIFGTGTMADWDDSMWKHDTSIVAAVIEEGVTDVGNSAFSSCTALQSVSLPSSIISIDSWAFSCCTGLQSIELPSGVTRIGAHAFSECSGLQNITIPDGVAEIEDHTFSGCSGLQSITIPAGVKSIGGSAFYHCSGLSEISLSSGIENIDDFAFSQCKNLRDITFPTSVKRIGSSAFNDCYQLQSIEIPSGVTAIEASTFSNCTQLTSVSLPAGIQCIGDRAFWSCHELQSIEIPSGVTSIGEKAFEAGSELESVSIPDSVLTIGPRAFYRCKKLTDITIPPYVTHIESECFSECENLKNVMLPEGLTHIGDCAFKKCTYLRSICIPATVAFIGESAFEECTWLESITLPSGVTRIEAGSFADCKNLTSVSLPASLESIGSTAFSNCVKLQSISIPSGTGTIEEQAFASCPVLQKITIPASVATIAGDDVFSGCDILVIYTSCGSAALSYAKNHAISYVTDDSVPHTVSSMAVTEPASCTLPGVKQGECSVCGKTVSEQIPAAGHTVTADKAVEATCTGTGLTEGSHCLICHEMISEQKTVPALGHSSDGGTVTKSAACTVAGVKTYKCIRCGSVLRTEAIAATGHKAVTDQAAAATCTKAGLTAGSHCSVCNAVLKKQAVIPAAGHSWGSWKVISEATALKEGSRERSCRKCSIKQVSKTAKLPAKLELEKNAVKIKKTKTGNVKIGIAAGDTVTVKTSNAKIATAAWKDGSVVIRAGKKAGKATITVMTKTGKSAGIKVTVPKVKTKKIKCKKLTVPLGKKEKLSPVVTPSYSDDKLKYSIKNKKIAAVSAKGVVKGKAVGTTTVTIKSGKKSVKVKISVVDLDTYENIFSRLLGS